MNLPIVTVTLNPAIDESITIEEFDLGGVNRCGFGSLDAGGKGLNASRVIHRLGRATLALGFVGGVTGAMIRERLDEEGVRHAFDDVEQMTRLNVMLYENRLSRRSRIYLPGAYVDAARFALLRQRLEAVAKNSIVVLGGSLPPGLDDRAYGDLVHWLHARDVHAIVDASGDALRHVLAAAPLVIKPDVEEASEILGTQIADDADAFAAARELRRLGAQNVVISQGAAGAVGISGSHAWKAHAPRILPRSTVGSGDSMVAGIAVALNEGGGLAEGLRLGTAAGAGTAMTPAAHLCRREDFESLLPRVRIESYPSQAMSA